MKILGNFVVTHSNRGACTCGSCIDAGPNPEKHQPTGHTADLIFFKVALSGGPKKEEFLKIVQEEYPHWLDGKEHSYLEIGADMGDQGLALMTMVMGYLLGVWKLFTPHNMLPGLDEETAMRMAGMGYVTIKAQE